MEPQVDIGLFVFCFLLHFSLNTEFTLFSRKRETSIKTGTEAIGFRDREEEEMYAETGLMYPYFQSFSQEVQQHFEDFCGIQKFNVSMDNLLPTSTGLEYGLGEGDLFKAPEAIVEDQLMNLDPMTDTVSIISGGNGVISSQTLKEMESIQSEQLLSEVFYDCKKDLLAKSAIQESFDEDLDVKILALQMKEDPIAEFDRLIMEGSDQKTLSSRCLEDPIEEIDRLIWEGSQTNCGSSRCLDDTIEEKDRFVLEDPKQKSVSTGCLSSMMHKDVMRPNFTDFHVDFGAAYGMRRAFSEGDIQSLNNRNTNLMRSPFERSLTIGNYTIEERMERLSRYRKKKAKRNFGRTIKYACRKALADNQPRVRGRFAKTEETDLSRK